MTIQEAIQSGKKFTRQSILNGNDAGGDFYETAEQFLEQATTEDILATDYILQPDNVSLNPDDFRAIWNSVRSSFTSVKSAEDSPLFQALSSRMFRR
jgi:hypothetical protein